MKYDRPKYASIEHDVLSISYKKVDGSSRKSQIVLLKNSFLYSGNADADESKMADFARI
jgi:hypothetical protein